LFAFYATSPRRLEKPGNNRTAEHRAIIAQLARQLTLNKMEVLSAACINTL